MAGYKYPKAKNPMILDRLFHLQNILNNWTETDINDYLSFCHYYFITDNSLDVQLSQEEIYDNLKKMEMVRITKVLEILDRIENDQIYFKGPVKTNLKIAGNLNLNTAFMLYKISSHWCKQQDIDINIDIEVHDIETLDRSYVFLNWREPDDTVYRHIIRWGLVKNFAYYS